MRMERKDGVMSTGSSCTSLRQPVKRTTAWEISDSDSEEEPSCLHRTGHVVPLVKVETIETSKEAEDVQGTLSSVDACDSVLTLPLSSSTSLSPTKKMRMETSLGEQEVEQVSVEEREKEIEVKKQQKQQQKEQEKADRELKKLEKERIKELVKMDREVKKQEKERKKNVEKMEAEKRKKTALALKLLRPDQCVKYMTVKVDAGILEDAGSEDVFEALRSAGYNYSIEPHPVPWSFTWRRDMPLDWTCVEGLELHVGEEDQVLVLIKPKDFQRNICSITQIPKNACTLKQSRETIGSAFGIPTQYSEKKVTLAVLGFRDYRWCQRLSRQMERQSLDQGREYNWEETENYVTRQQIAEALVTLQLSFDTEVLYLDTWKELGQHLCAVTKSVAQLPFRKHWEAQTFSFCTSAGSWRGWGPKGSVSGLPLVWKRQVQQLNRISPAMAAAVTQAYPSPQLLMQAYAACNTDREKMFLLSDIRVLQEHNVGATETMEEACEDEAFARDSEQSTGRERRIGPDISRRIWLCMTTTNPELVLDLNSS